MSYSLFSMYLRRKEYLFVFLLLFCTNCIKHHLIKCVTKTRKFLFVKLSHIIELKWKERKTEKKEQYFIVWCVFLWLKQFTKKCFLSFYKNINGCKSPCVNSLQIPFYSEKGGDSFSIIMLFSFFYHFSFKIIHLHRILSIYLFIFFFLFKIFNLRHK